MQSFCPFCERTTTAVSGKAPETYTVRGTAVKVEVESLTCTECGNEFRSPEHGQDIAELALRVYRDHTGYLLPEQIRDFRKSVGLTQQELGRLLGWGSATISRYENGALQDEAHDKALRMIMKPDVLLEAIERNPEAIRDGARTSIVATLRSDSSKSNAFLSFINLFSADYEPDIYSGFRSFDPAKFFNMILHFCRGEGIPKTKLNKELWYSDFVFFHKHTVSISGARYAHLPYGPAPDNYDTLLAYLSNMVRSLATEERSNGAYAWEVLVSCTDPDYSVFSNAEIQTLASVRERFAKTTARELSDLSHQEQGYIETRDGQVISYDYACQLKLAV